MILLFPKSTTDAIPSLTNLDESASLEAATTPYLFHAPVRPSLPCIAIHCAPDTPFSAARGSES